jgi:multiple sugar transport system permease protein
MKKLRGGPDCSRSGYLFLLPNFTGFLLFVLLPVLASLALSFCRWEILKERTPTFIGLANFTKLLTNADFWYHTYNTMFLMLGIPVGMMLSLALALLLNRSIRGIKLFRMVYFLPTVTAGVALLVLWMWIYEPLYGLFNAMLSQIGIEGPNWLGGGTEISFLQKWFGIDPMCYWAKPALMFMGLWTGVGGYNMILYLAALHGINPELYEAAQVDGAGPWQKFRNITWPMLSPTTFFVFIMSLIDGFQGGFEAAYVMTQGGPAGSTTTISFQIFQELYENDRAGYASAIAWFLFLVVFLLTMASWRFGGRAANYD